MDTKIDVDKVADTIEAILKINKCTMMYDEDLGSVIIVDPYNVYAHAPTVDDEE